MRCYLATVPILALLISGCASEGGRTTKPIAGTDNGPSRQAPAADATPGVTVTDTVSGGTVAGATPKTTAAGAGPGPKVAGAAPGVAAGPVAYQKNRTAGAIFGAVGGGLAGGAVGPYMNSQKQDLQKNLQDEIRSGSASVDKLPHNVVRIRMHARAAFDTNSSSIKPAFCTTIDKVADVVIRYGKTTLTVVGPADNKGTVEHNRKLSRQRAFSVAQYLESKDVNPVRLATAGKGAADLTPRNTNDPGRQTNRRVEILVEPVLAK
jgi:outer membrane protein OmpA-like peptidoglycan-associated protein